VTARVAMIGLDAAELAFVRAAPAQLPALHRLLAGGALHRLRSPADLLPGAVWPTFATGRAPGEHGIYHHLQWDAGAMRLRRVAADWLYAEPFWYPLAREGRRILAVDVPMGFPPRLDGAIEVTNWGSHDQLGPLACEPRALARDIRRRFGGHPMGSEIPVGKSAAELADIRDRLVRGARRKGELVAWLATQVRWDLLIAVFGETHRGGHILWPDGPHAGAVPPAALRDVYRAVDEALAALLASPALAGAHVVLFALHGMGPNTSQEHFVAPVMDRVNAGFAGIAGGAPPGPPALVRWLRRHVPAAVQNRMARMVPVRVRDEVVNRSIVAGHAWARTPGLDLLADLSGYLRLNVRGRERDGILARDGDELARYVDWVRRCFTALQGPSGERLVDAVHRTADRFPGPRTDHLPDLIVTWTGGPSASRAEGPEVGSLTAPLATGRTGNHRAGGFCVIGPGLAHLDPPADVRDLGRLARAALA
jgi:predicted AlkP superfamily phosphohydrolase/phosphomutase